MTTKLFPTASVLSTITGVLVSEQGIGAVYEVLNWMTGESVYTHQIPRIGEEARPVVLELHPHLAQACEEAKQINPDNWRQWLETWEERYGDMIAVPKMTADQHERIDPLSELAERVHPDKIIIVSPDAEQP